VKRFHFPLDRVRRWRAEQATLEELKLEQLRGQLTALQEEKRRIETERSQSEQEVLRQASMEASELQSLDVYRLHTWTKVRDIESRERQMAAPIEEQRQRVIDAQRNAELLERLKQKARVEWQTASDREQEGLAAELYLARWTRRR
jgi:hypothetical protein